MARALGNCSRTYEPNSTATYSPFSYTYVFILVELALQDHSDTLHDLPSVIDRQPPRTRGSLHLWIGEVLVFFFYLPIRIDAYLRI